MSDDLFRKTLDWFMCADPWPFSKGVHEEIESRLAAESVRRGFNGWIDAFHRFEL